MSAFNDLDVICSQQLLDLERQFDHLASQVDFDLLDLELAPTSVSVKPQVAASSSNSGTCALQFEPCPPNQASSRFTLPKSDKDVAEARATAVPKNTRTIEWAVNVWKAWTSNRREICHAFDCPPHLYLCTNEEYNHWLSKFVLEIKRADGQLYPPSTLYSICCEIQRYVRDRETGT